MGYIHFTAAIGFMLVAFPAYAVPSLLPLLPVMGVLIAKGVLLFSSVFFLLLSYIKKHRKLYLGIGVVLFITFALAMVFVRHV
jgi:heme/copper-type cytochrome/quinol oxidase subunit 3